ncbi:type 1 glutamine amidotransferase domain-containing protein [uncultured Anaerococcus sp.]|uniref:type 1 glutamine amidotransferase domain-containing protein n=1 Tax=uncultured Anaerococcus sp. TaxID=293428 RepID=UPI0025E9FE35|nr:type 1 glutamine amidotransferase domain-containing protein [uncultured Anaerococcus sp.]
MKKVAILIENKYEEPELIYPYWRLKEDYEVVLVGTEADTEYVGKAGGYKMKSDIASSDAKASDFDAVYIPGGFSPDAMRQSEDTVNFVKEMHEAGKLIGAICHGPWVLAEADILDGVKATSVKTISTDIKNAGANWVDEETVVDNNIVTARTPEDLPAHVTRFVEELGK